MNVIRVVVDELPEGCNECAFRDYFSADNGDGGIMLCTANKTDERQWQAIYYPSVRPDWCPLAKEGEENGASN